MQAVYTIGILDFIFDDADKHEVIHTVQLKNQKNQVFYDKLSFIYLTLPNFTKPLEALETPQDKWLYVFRHLSELAEAPSTWQEQVFQKLFHVAALTAFQPQERDAYQASLKYYRDMKNVTATAYGEGVVDGRQVGRAEGLQEGRLECKAFALQKLLRKCFTQIPPEIQQRIAQADSAQRDIWLDRVLQAQQISDVFR